MFFSLGNAVPSHVTSEELWRRQMGSRPVDGTWLVPMDRWFQRIKAPASKEYLVACREKTLGAWYGTFGEDGVRSPQLPVSC